MAICFERLFQAAAWLSLYYVFFIQVQYKVVYNWIAMVQYKVYNWIAMYRNTPSW